MRSELKINIKKDKMTPLEICREFISCKIESASPFGDGHINETFLVNTENGRFVCQRLGSKMDTAALEKNFRLYAPACERFGLVYPVWIKNNDGNFFYTESDGNRWRMYPYLEGEILPSDLSGKNLCACGQGIARIHAALNTMQDRPEPVYPMLHDLTYYYEEYQKLFEGPYLIKENRDAGMEDMISSGIGRMLQTAREYGPPSVVHGDMKLANILFRDGQVIGFLDFDTVMVGYPEEDLADCIRSCCIRDGILDKDAADVLIRGYLDNLPIGGSAKVPRDFEELSKQVWKAFRKICFELGLRYYTDAISEKKHFRRTSPGYRVAKAGSLLNIALSGKYPCAIVPA